MLGRTLICMCLAACLFAGVGCRKTVVVTPEITDDMVLLPEAWPADLPLYEDAEVLTIKEDAEPMSILAESKTDMTKLADFYATKLAANGWTVERPAATAEQATLKATKGTMTADVTISNGPVMRGLEIKLSGAPKK
ncbi:MAG TPA: hypothetical protein VGE52_12105 [Pirellulales bacterium]